MFEALVPSCATRGARTGITAPHTCVLEGWIRNGASRRVSPCPALRPQGPRRYRRQATFLKVTNHPPKVEAPTKLPRRPSSKLNRRNQISQERRADSSKRLCMISALRGAIAVLLLTLQLPPIAAAVCCCSTRVATHSCSRLRSCTSVVARWSQRPFDPWLVRARPLFLAAGVSRRCCL